MSAENWILEAYRRADEQGRLDLYMSSRELRDEFAEIDAAPVVQEAQPAVETVSLREKWNFCGRFMRVFSS